MKAKLRILILFLYLLGILTTVFSKSMNEIRYVKPRSGLRLRKKSNTKGKMITLMPYGAKVRILDKSGKIVILQGKRGKWIKVVYKKLIGWTFNAYLTKLPRLFPLRLNKIGITLYLPNIKHRKQIKNTSEDNRAGSIYAYDIPHVSKSLRNDGTSEILIHSIKSCKKFSKNYPDPPPYHGFPKSWFHPDAFKAQKKAIKKNRNLGDYKLIKSKNFSYLYNCEFSPNAESPSAEVMIFFKNYRILFKLSQKSCNKKGMKPILEYISNVKIVKN